MAARSMVAVLHYLRRLAGPPAGETTTDRQLLEQFARSHDEAAFAELVQRHAGLVWSVCRRTLTQAEDAEDAFQATFFVLARKAGRLRWETNVAAWLHAVALRTALKARTANARRQARERHVGEMRRPEANQAPAACEVKPVLDEEVQRLPWKYRAPVLLHYFEGKT